VTNSKVFEELERETSATSDLLNLLTIDSVFFLNFIIILSKKLGVNLDNIQWAQLNPYPMIIATIAKASASRIKNIKVPNIIPTTFPTSLSIKTAQK